VNGGPLRPHDVRPSANVYGLVFGLIFVMSLIVFSSKFLPVPYESSIEKSLTITLRTYNNQGLLRNSLIDNPERNFPVTRQSLDIGNKTLGQVKQEVAAMVASGRPIEESLTFREFVTEIAKAYLNGTSFEEKVTVNDLPQKGYVNIYFLDADPNHISPRFERSCLYTGHLNMVVCDTRFITELLQNVDQVDYLYDLVILRFGKSGIPYQPMFTDYKIDFARRYMKTALITWVIGHELAHALLHKKRVVNDGPLHFNLQYDPVEKEADEFVARKLAGDPLLGIRFKPMLGEFIQQEVKRIYFPEEYKKPINDPTKVIELIPSKPIDARYSRFDVPLTLRAIQMVLAMYDVDPQINDRASYGVIESDVALLHSLALRTLYEDVANKISVKDPSLNIRKYRYLGFGLGLVAFSIMISRILYEKRRTIT